MLYRSMGLIAPAAVLWAALSAVQAADVSKFPDLKGQWNTLSPRGSFDSDQVRGQPTAAPLTEEYKAVHAANLADQAAGGMGTEPSYMCLPPGMPRSMIAYEAMEVVVTPHTTYILIDHIHDSRRIYTDGRNWPAEIEPSYAGYSIGKWSDADGTGQFNLLEVETRGFKGPRAYDTSGLPLHSDNQTVVKERIYQDKADQNILYDEITVIDHALTRPWTVTRKYQRDPDPQPVWREVVCTENNQHVHIGQENYFIGADGFLMPAKKDQAPPDLKYFKQSRK
jgi:hypothetical protein